MFDRLEKRKGGNYNYGCIISDHLRDFVFFG